MHPGVWPYFQDPVGDPDIRAKQFSLGTGLWFGQRLGFLELHRGACLGLFPAWLGGVGLPRGDDSQDGLVVPPGILFLESVERVQCKMQM